MVLGSSSAHRAVSDLARTRRVVTSAIAVLAMLVAGCATLPPPEGRTETHAFVDTATTRLGRAIAPEVAAHPGLSGVHKFPDPRDAFAARMLLAGAAEKSIDAQYFIWNGDEVGYLLWEALWKAAERGVRVRLLLDDANTLGNDATIAALDAHPNIEVRLYNPFTQRGSRSLGYLTDFKRLNRRMHNKSFTADNQMTVVGGRNIANEYFGAGEGIGFADTDVVAIGPIVKDVSREFDLYWNSASAYPAAGFVGTAGPDAAEKLLARFAQKRADAIAVAYLDAVEKTTLMDELRDRTLRFEWITGTVLYDDPAKTLDAQARPDVLLAPELVKSLGMPEKSLDIVSPYFVPGDQGTAALSELARRGVRVRILTNSLAASDESVVHTGYARRRTVLLTAGVALWELKPTATDESLKVKGRFGSAKVAGLHAKTYAVDSRRIFVGSFNFDQRSEKLNTEMGIVLDSARFAGDLAQVFDELVPSIAYEVRLAPDGNGLVWIERTSSGDLRYDTEPQTSWWLRTKVELLSILPIEWLL
jgi:putative cardiolipin synthase